MLAVLAAINGLRLVDEKYLNICEQKGKKKRYSQPFLFFKVMIGEMMEKSGQIGVPVIEVNGRIIIGFDKDALKKALKMG